MKITVEKVTDWDLVYRTALFTQGKVPKKQFPSEIWKKKTVIAQHSPLRALQFLVIIEDVDNYTLGHLVRHVHLQPYIRTMREDLTGVPGDKITRNTPNSGMFLVNAQEMINVSMDRLCNKADKKTKLIWYRVVAELKKIEPLLDKMCVPRCEAIGYCKEYVGCGYRSDCVFGENREKYLDFVESESN